MVTGATITDDILNLIFSILHRKIKLDIKSARNPEEGQNCRSLTRSCPDSTKLGRNEGRTREARPKVKRYDRFGFEAPRRGASNAVKLEAERAGPPRYFAAPPRPPERPNRRDCQRAGKPSNH